MRSSAMIALIMLTCSTSFADGVFFKSEETWERYEGLKTNRQVFLDSNHIRIDTEAFIRGRRRVHITIYDAIKRKIYVILPERKVYLEADPVSPHDRRVKFASTGASRTVNGFKCEVFNVRQNGVPVAKDCIVPWAPSFLSIEDRAAVLRIIAATGSIPDVDKYVPFDLFPGYPAQHVVLLPAGEEGSDERVTQITHAPLPPDTFEIPPGYTEEKAPRPSFGCGCRIGSR